MADSKDKARNPDRQGKEARDGGFIASPAEANVFPAGAAQADDPPEGIGGKPGDSAAGTPDEGRLGGTGGTSASGTTGNDPDR